MDANARELITLGDRLFTRKAQLDELWQTVSEQIYPERANFTVSRVDGEEFATELYESGPPQARRDLAGAIGAILRPRAKEWFKPKPKDTWRQTARALAWCDFARDRMRGLLYNEATMFQKTMADADDDFCSFGNALPILSENGDRDGFFFELTHLKDNAWTTNRANVVDVNHRKFKKTLRWVYQKWGSQALSAEQLKTMEKDPYREIEIRHVLMPADDYDFISLPRKALGGKTYASIYINVEGQKIAKEGGYWEFPMLHRRWRVPSDSAYGYSPAAMLGLVDARLLQSQSRVILDAGELAVAPPLVAKRDAVLGGINNYAGAVTFVDMEYDERLGDAIRPLETGGDVRLGLEMKVDTRNILQAAFYLNKLTLPSDKDMTAYEASERIAEYIRSAGPIFEPFEADNARMLNTMFDMGLRIGYFGPIEEMPPELRGGEIEFEFDTPVSQAYRRVKVMRANEVVTALGPIAQIEPSVKDNVNFDKLARSTMDNIGGDADWKFSEEEVAQTRQARQQKMDEMEKMQKADAALSAADKAGSAGQKFARASKDQPQILQQLQAMQQQGQGDQSAIDAGFPQAEGMPVEDSGDDFAIGLGDTLDIPGISNVAA